MGGAAFFMQIKCFSRLPAAVCDRTASLSIKVSGDYFNKHSCLRPRCADSAPDARLNTPGSESDSVCV